MDEVRKKWAEQASTSPRVQNNENAEKIAAARKEIIRVVNWNLNDDKHRKIEQIKDTVDYLVKIIGNVRDQPTEEKYRRVSWPFHSRCCCIVISEFLVEVTFNPLLYAADSNFKRYLWPPCP